ncbi:MAG: hypothetical protein SNF68_05770 [Rikenellaceae bacterium]
MSKALSDLGCYETYFLIYLNGDSEVAGEGYYRVDGDCFFLAIADQEVYGDGVERYSINHTQREVVLERVVNDGSQPLLIINPAVAFLKLAEEFDVEEQTEGLNNNSTELKLTPKSEDNILQSSLLSIDNETYLPKSISYRVDEEEVSIILLDIRAAKEVIEISYPSDYEVIDIR